MILAWIIAIFGVLLILTVCWELIIFFLGVGIIFSIWISFVWAIMYIISGGTFK